MWPVSAAWLAALAQPHGVTVSVEAWRDGARYGTVPISGGTVTVNSRNRVRRTLRVQVAESLWSQAGSGGLLDPYGNELVVRWSLVGASGATVDQPVPVFRGRIDTVDRTRFAGELEVSCSDLFAGVVDARFTTPRVAAGNVVSSIISLIQEVYPGTAVTVDTRLVDASVPAGMMWDTDRGQAIDDLAQAIGAEVYADPLGAFRIVPVPTIVDAPVASLVDGSAGTVVADALSRSRVGVANAVVVLVEQTGADPLRVLVTDDDPASPTVYGGRFGMVPATLTSALIATEDQARTAGRAKLARSIGLTRQRTIRCVPNPALEGGDVLSVMVGGELERHVIDTCEFDLTSAGVMSIGTRSARDSGADE